MNSARKTAIWKRRQEIDRELRAKMQAVSDLHHKEHRAEMDALKQECGELGHEWRFTHIGPTGAAWHVCKCCGKTTTDIVT